MSSEDDEENSKDKAAADWISRIYGGAAVVFGIWGFFQDADGIFERLGNLLVMAFGSILFVGLFVMVPLMIFDGAKNVASQEKNPFKQGIAFVWFICLASCALDLLLMGGTFIVIPIVFILFYGSMEGTFWGCDDWVIMDEGSYCAD